MHINGNRVVDDLSRETYGGLSFLPPAKPRLAVGSYEFRTYFLEVGGLLSTLNGWQGVIEPVKDYTSHLVVNMFALDGLPRITRLRGFENVQQRSALRGRHYVAGLWPPKGGPDQIDHAVPKIALSDEGSLLS